MLISIGRSSNDTRTSGRDYYFLIITFYEALLSPGWRPFCVCMANIACGVTLRSWHCVPCMGPHTWIPDCTWSLPYMQKQGAPQCCHRFIHRRQRKRLGGELASPSITPAKAKEINTCSSESYYPSGEDLGEKLTSGLHMGALAGSKVEKRAGFMKWSNRAPRMTEILL